MGEPNCNWQDDEKIQLCDSWARVIVCPITEKCITSSKLWDKVLADYVENWRGPPTSQSAQACQSQFRALKKELKDWHNAQVKARSNIASGTNLMDEMNQAQTNYMKKHPKKFDKWACWEKVKHHPSFVDTPSNARPPVSYSTPPIDDAGNESLIDLEDDIVLETPSSFMPRPMGQQRAKEAMRKGKKVQDAAESMTLAIQSMAESTQASVELVRQRNEEIAAHSRRVFKFEQAKEDAKIMGKDTTSMSLDEKRWWKARKRSIMVKTLFDGGDGSSDFYIPQFD